MSKPDFPPQPPQQDDNESSASQVEVYTPTQE